MLDIKYYIKSGTNKVYCRVSKGRISNGGFMVRKAVNKAVLNDARNWKNDKEQVKVCKDEPQAKSINNIILKHKISFNKGIQELELDEIEPNNINVSNIIDNIDNSVSKTRARNKFSFTDNLEDYIEAMKSGKILKPDTLKPYSERTIKGYGTLLFNLKKFEEINGVVKPNKVNYQMYLDLITFFRNIGLNDNTIGGIVKNLKAVINNYFIKMLRVKFRHYIPSEWKKVSNETLNTYLTLPELHKLLNLDLTSYPKMYDEVRDAYCFIAFTCGIRIGDYMKLKEHHLTNKMVDGKKVQYIEFKQSKTGGGVKAPLNKISLALLKKHNGLPKLASDVKANEILKKLGKMCGFDTWCILEDKDGNQLRKERKYNLLTNHSARRSFCTNAWDMKTDLIQIMKMSGHKSPDILLKYIGKSLDEYADRMLETDYFKAVNDIENTVKLKAV